MTWNAADLGVALHGGERVTKQRSRGAVALRDQLGDGVEDEIGSGRRCPRRKLERPRDVRDLDGRHRTRVAEEDRHLDRVEHGVASAMYVQRLERSRRVEHHRGDLARLPRRVGARSRVDERDRGFELPGSGEEQRVVEVRQRTCEVRLGADGVAGGQVGGRRAEQSNRSLAAVRRELARRVRAAPPTRRGSPGSRRDAAARSSSAATSSSGDRAAAARCHALRSGSRSRVARGGQCFVGSTPIGVTGALVHGRANERVAERDVRPELEQPGCLRRHDRACSSKSSSRPARQIEPTSPVGSAAATSRSRWVGSGKRTDLAEEVPFESPADGERLGQRRGSRELVG